MNAKLKIQNSINFLTITAFTMKESVFLLNRAVIRYNIDFAHFTGLITAEERAEFIRQLNNI